MFKYGGLYTEKVRSDVMEEIIKYIEELNEVITDLKNFRNGLMYTLLPIEIPQEDNKVFKVIKQSGGEGILRKDLYRKLNLRADVIEYNVARLALGKKITVEKEGSKGGRKPIRYKVI
jgi:hypothetical protein